MPPSCKSRAVAWPSSHAVERQIRGSAGALQSPILVETAQGSGKKVWQRRQTATCMCGRTRPRAFALTSNGAAIVARERRSSLSFAVPAEFRPVVQEEKISLVIARPVFRQRVEICNVVLEDRNAGKLTIREVTGKRHPAYANARCDYQ